MTVAAGSQPGARPLTRWLTVLGLVCVLVGPALVVMLIKRGDGGGGSLDTEHLRIAQLPSDVAVQGGTVWVASGRDNRIVAINTTKPSAAPNPHATGPSPIRVAVGSGSVWTANAGNGTVSAFSLLDPERPRHLQTLSLGHGANPWGLALDPTGRTLFVVDPRAVDGVPKILGNRLHVLVVKENGRLSENDADRQHLPVEDGAAPLGIAVVPA